MWWDDVLAAEKGSLGEPVAEVGKTYRARIDCAITSATAANFNGQPFIVVTINDTHAPGATIELEVDGFWHAVQTPDPLGPMMPGNIVRLSPRK